MPDMCIPKGDAQLLGWAQAFATGIEDRPAAFAVSPSVAQHIRATVDQYAHAHAVAASPATRTVETVNVKDTARNSMVELLRVHMNIIRANQGIDDSLKESIGMHIAKTQPTPRPCPQTSPRLGLVAATPGRVNLTYADSLSPNVKAKPFGAHRLELVGVLVDRENGEAIPVDPPENPINFGSFTRNRFAIDPPKPPKAMHLYLWGRWAGARGEVGPWSNVLHAGIFSKIRPDPATIVEKRKRERKPRKDDASGELRMAA